MIVRLRPLLGTFVRIELEPPGGGLAGADPDDDLVSQAFAVMSRIHAAMSFHDPLSELSRLNAASPGTWIEVSRDLGAVIGRALAIAELSGGAFDPVVAARCAVAAGALPPPCARAPDALGDWRDIELDTARSAVRLHRAVWVDLGGVAKGWAVDCAVEALMAGGAGRGSVDAGGDMRVWGRPPHAVALDALTTAAPLPVVELEDGALASSGGLSPRDDLAAQAHVDGRGGCEIEPSFAAVVAPDCMSADALTKVVLSMGLDADAVLRQCGATGYHLVPGREWAVLGAASS